MNDQASELRKFMVMSSVTISLNAEVLARDAAHAKEIAENLGMCSIHESTHKPDAADGDWHTSGELDGEPFDITAEAMR